MQFNMSNLGIANCQKSLMSRAIERGEPVIFTGGQDLKRGARRAKLTFF